MAWRQDSLRNLGVGFGTCVGSALVVPRAVLWRLGPGPDAALPFAEHQCSYHDDRIAFRFGASGYQSAQAQTIGLFMFFKPGFHIKRFCDQMHVTLRGLG